MRSLRRSLTAYLLGLLTITLGFVGVLIDQVVGRTLDARENATVERIESQYQDRCRDEKRRIDDTLLQEARKLGKEMQSQYRPRFEREMEKFNASRMAHTFGFGHPLVNVWWFNVNNNWVPSSRLFWDYFSRISIGEEIFRSLDEQEHTSDYIQVNRPLVNSPGGRTPWRSESLEEQSLPFDPKRIEDLIPEDSALVPSGKPVRRVVIKVAVPAGATPPNRNRGRTPPGGGMRPENRGPGGGMPFPRPSGPPAPPPVESTPMVYLQCARPISALDDARLRFQAERNQLLETVALEVKLERTTLRSRLLLIGLITFTAIAVGGPLLVGAGLRPLRALSDAVSLVSEKDFKLPHDGQGMPRELQAIHARLTQTLEMLRRAFAREKQSVADISHELRTPIASLQATLDVALRKPRTPEQYRNTLDECRLINRQLGQLVERIMTLASLDSGNDRTEVFRVDAFEIAAGCAAVIRPLAVAHGQTLDVDVAAPLELDTDPDKLREVLMNLLHNAVEYNKPDGHVEVKGFRENDRVVFEIRDTGIGMTPDVRDRIFERFFRADPSRHATGIHAGLGLAIVKEYVGRLNGTITVASEAGQGSRFTLSFPAPQDADTSQPEPSDWGEPVAMGS